MTDKKNPNSPPKKSRENKEGLFITTAAILHNNLYEPPSHKTLNDNKGSLKDTLKRFQGLFILTLVAGLLTLLMYFS